MKYEEWPEKFHAENFASTNQVMLVAAARYRNHQWCLTLTPNNTETIERMKSLFSATNKKRPYEQLLHNWTNQETSGEVAKVTGHFALVT